MTERPILFSGPMVRALLSGQKTQTRRVVKGIGERTLDFDRQWFANVMRPSEDGVWTWWDGPPHGQNIYHSAACPYGLVGDRLWVRETWAPVPATAYRHSDGVQQVVNPNDPHIAAIFAADWDRSIPKWKPSIHMPRWASRLTLQITDIRVERLLACSDADARAEGLKWVTPGMWSVDRSLPIIGDDARQVYFELWDHINGTGAAAANPWVWAITFEVVK